MKILVNTPSLKHLGGVANHYLGLRPFWTEQVRYNTVGKRSNKAGSGKYWLPWDLLKFVFRLLTFRPDVVLLNPSLGAGALRRDFVFLRVARALGFRVAVFIHGFNLDYARTVDTTWVKNNLNRASLVFVLARQFKSILEEWGVSTPIVLSTTKVDDRMLKDFDVEKRRGEAFNILFLARVERAKGVYITIDSYAYLKPKYPDLTLTIVGGGSELDAVRDYVKERCLDDVRITGPLSGQALVDEYRRANLSSSSSYGEGMPTAVLEAMAFGLPVFTRNVGGLPDFFEDGKMGYITDSLDPKDFAEAMVPYIESPERTRKVALYNARYAREHFLASKVAGTIENELRKYVKA